MINTALFDFDQTLADTRFISALRAIGHWDAVRQQIPNVRLFPGIYELFAYLHREQVKIGIVSQSPREDYIEPVCTALNLQAETIVGYHDVDKRKPYPDPLFTATARLWRSTLIDSGACKAFLQSHKSKPFDVYRSLGIDAENVIAIGDASNDIEAARRAKAISVGALWGTDFPDEIYLAEPNYVCASPEDVIALIEDLKHRTRYVKRGDQWASDATTGYINRCKEWTRVDTSPRHRKHLTGTEECYHLRRRIKGTWAASLTNNYISSFKATPTAKNQVNNKEKLAERFARELAPFLERGASCMVVPTSKMRGHPEFDPRFDMFGGELLKRRPDLRIIEPIELLDSKDAAHATKEKELRSPTSIMQNYQWNPAKWTSANTLYIIDDVLTSGGHFKAAELFVRANTSMTGRIIGIGWALEVDGIADFESLMLST